LIGEFGWVFLAHTQYKNLILIQIADITGAYGVSFLIVAVNVLLKEYIFAQIAKRKFWKDKEIVIVSLLTFVLIDTEAGISENVTYFNTAAQEILVVTTPDPTAITDAYALMKLLSTQYHEKKIQPCGQPDSTRERSTRCL